MKSFLIKAADDRSTSMAVRLSLEPPWFQYQYFENEEDYHTEISETNIRYEILNVYVVSWDSRWMASTLLGLIGSTHYKEHTRTDLLVSGGLEWARHGWPKTKPGGELGSSATCGASAIRSRALTTVCCGESASSCRGL